MVVYNCDGCGVQSHLNPVVGQRFNLFKRFCSRNKEHKKMWGGIEDSLRHWSLLLAPSPAVRKPSGHSSHSYCPKRGQSSNVSTFQHGIGFHYSKVVGFHRAWDRIEVVGFHRAWDRIEHHLHGQCTPPEGRDCTGAELCKNQHHTLLKELMLD